MKPFYKDIVGVVTLTLLFLIPGSHAVAGIPLQILSFSAQQSDKDVLLDWKTQHEGSTDYFEVERSTDALVYTTIGRLNASNTSGMHTYRLKDARAEGTNKTFYYRLKQVDLDRNVTYIPIIRLSFGLTENAAALFPNPIGPRTTLQVTQVRPGPVQVRIIDNMGKPIRQYSYQLTGGTTSLPFNVGGLAPGSYYVEVRGAVFDRVIRFVRP